MICHFEPVGIYRELKIHYILVNLFNFHMKNVFKNDNRFCFNIKNLIPRFF